jgi:hypothetical protein
MRLHDEEIHDLYSSNIRVIKSRRIRWAGYVTCMGENCIEGFVEKPEGKRPFGRPRRTYKDNFKMDIQEIG